MEIGRVADIGTVTQQTSPKAAEQRGGDKQTSLAADNTDKFIKAGATFTPAYTKASIHKNNADNNSTEKYFAEDKVERSKQFTKPPLSDVEEKSLRDYALMTLIGECIAEKIVPRPPILRLNMPQIRMKSPEERFTELKDKFGGFNEDESYWKAKSCAERILGFALVVSNSDSTLAQSLKTEVHIAANEAEAVYGGIGSLSDNCYLTLKITEAALDKWQKIGRMV